MQASNRERAVLHHHMVLIKSDHLTLLYDSPLAACNNITLRSRLQVIFWSAVMYRLLNFRDSNKNKMCFVVFIIVDFDKVAEMEDNLDLEGG